MKFLLKSSLIALLLVIATAPLVHAGDTDIAAVKKAITKHLPQAANATVKATPVEGLFEVVTGGQVMYVTKDARYIFDGDLYDMQLKKNITEDARSTIRLAAINELGEKNMLVYMPKGKVRHTITVFTDIYCPYCRKLHNEMDDYLNNGVKVRYIFVPFKGQKSMETSVSVWCADDRNKAMDLAKGGSEVEKKSCDNPVSKHKQLAAQLGIRGTPAILLESGELMPGYVPSSRLIKKLNEAH